MASSENAPTLSVPSYWHICAPGKLWGYRTSATTATLTWDEPYATCHLCPDALNYEIVVSAMGSFTLIRPPFELEGLQPGADYVLDVYANAGGGVRSSRGRFRLGISPGAPAGLRVRMLDTTSASLSWNAPASSVAAFDYQVYCDGVFMASVRELECVLTGLPGSNSPRFEVRARSNASNCSNAASVTPPAPPANVEIVADTPLSVSLTWDAAAGAQAYEVSINGVLVDTVTNPRYVARNLVGPYFSFGVAVRDASGNVSVRQRRSISNPDREPPTRPPGLRLLSSTSSSVTLGWDDSRDNVMVAGYRFFSPDGTQADIQEKRYTVTGLQAGVTYYCAVRAYDPAGNLSDVSSIDVSPNDKQPPSSPTNLRVVRDFSNEFRMAWDPSQDNVGIRDYTVSLWTDKDALIFTDTTVQTYYTMVDKLVPGKRYVFWVQANDHAGNASPRTGSQLQTPFFVQLEMVSRHLLIGGERRFALLHVVDGQWLPIVGAEVGWSADPGLHIETASGILDSSGSMLNAIQVADDISTHNASYRIFVKLSTGHRGGIFVYTPGLRHEPSGLPGNQEFTLYLQAADAASHPLGNAYVEWSSEPPGLYLSPTTAVTDDDGRACVMARPLLGAQAQTYTVTATVEGHRFDSRGITIRAGTP